MVLYQSLKYLDRMNVHKVDKHGEFNKTFVPTLKFMNENWSYGNHS